MPKNKTLLLFLSMLFLVPVLFFVYDHLSRGENGPKNIEAKTKSKWQRMLERNNVDVSLWKKYLPNITHKEYKKVTKAISRSVNPLATNLTPDSVVSSSQYPLHSNISTTYFWIGEEAGEDNKNISNSPSAWDDKWVSHYGGVDDPAKRNGFLPSKFTPKENPFYFALPYNDFDENGNRKKDIATLIPWFGEKNWGDGESICKNRWIKIIKGNKVAYAQWEDVGPFGENDSNYVFGGASPQSKTNKDAGLDVSPAVNDYLGLKDIDTTSWQFVDQKDVPNGPWKNIVTTSGVCWE